MKGCTAGPPMPVTPVPVPRAPITHAHADHARPGCGETGCCQQRGVLRQRPGKDITLHPVQHEEHWLGQCRVSFHSAGHVLGSAQIRLEVDGEVGGERTKRDADPSCEP